MSSHIAQFSVYSRPQRIIKIHLAVFDVVSVCFTILFSLFSAGGSLEERHSSS